MKVNTNYMSIATSLFTITARILVLTGCFYYIPSLIPGFFFILTGIALYLRDALNSSQRRKTPTYFILLPKPGCRRLVNLWPGKSPGEMVTQLISLTTCAMQTILIQWHFAKKEKK